MTGTPKSDPPEKMDQAIADALAEAEAAVDAVRGDAPPEAEAAEEDDAASAAPEADSARLAELVAEVEALKAELASTKDRWLRAVADHENAKKRAKREMEETVNRSLQKVLSDILPVADNLDRALAAADPEDKLAQGVVMVKGVFDAALAKHDIKPIETVGTAFDPSLHDALQQVDSPDHAPGVIIQEFERGYTRGGKLFRPARVIVAGPGSTGGSRPPEDDSEDDVVVSEVADGGEEQ